MPKLAKSLRDTARRLNKKREPLWRGPIEEGVTQGLLGKFVSGCRERFRLLVVEGLKPAEQFNPRTAYGDMWHVCEAALAEGGLSWELMLKNHCKELALRFKSQGEQIQHWWRVCETQFPIYVEHWKHHKDVKKRVPVFQEQTFQVDYPLPSGRTVKLLGKYDAVDNIGGKLWLQENKTKADINEQKIVRQLRFDLQTMFYLVSLAVLPPKAAPIPIGGVRYNLIRRPCSGGKFSIVQHKGRMTKKGLVGKESSEEFYVRLGGLIEENAEYFFMRQNVDVQPSDIEAFCKQCLDPYLEQLCDWYERIMLSPYDPWVLDKDSYNGLHARMPFGLYNTLLEGGSTEYDEYMDTGSELGLQRVETLFPELVEV